MSKTHFRTLVVCVFSLAAAPAGGTQYLTAEFRFADHGFGNFSDTPPSSLPLRFAIFFGQLSRETSEFDIGQTFTPEPDQLALMALGITNDPFQNAQFGVDWGPDLRYGFYESALLGGGYRNAWLTVHAPSLRSYPLSNVTITVDDFAIMHVPGAWSYRVGLTARLYAQAVPEPFSSVIALVAFCFVACLRHRGTPHQPVPAV